MVLDRLDTYGLERAVSHVQRDLGAPNAARVESIEQLAREVQTGRRRGYRPARARIHRLVSLAVRQAIAAFDVRRQRNVTETLAALAARGVERTEVTLHVGYGTFKPVRVEAVEDHVVDPESFTVSPDAAAALTRARREGRRVIAVGTTTTRALESLQFDAEGRAVAATGETALFIRPGHEFRVVQGLITNFHLPRSSLLMLVAAFAGRERALAAYRHAVAAKYRFYSYGDAMLIV